MGLNPHLFEMPAAALCCHHCSVQALSEDQQQQQLAAPLAAAVTSLAWSRNGRHLLSGSLDKRVILWDVLSGEPVRDNNNKHDAVFRLLYVAGT
jgi:WD40 repeat protein